MSLYIVGKITPFNYTNIASDGASVHNVGNQRDVIAINALDWKDALSKVREQNPNFLPTDAVFNIKDDIKGQVVYRSQNYPAKDRQSFYVAYELQSGYLF